MSSLVVDRHMSPDNSQVATPLLATPPNSWETIGVNVDDGLQHSICFMGLMRTRDTASGNLHPPGRMDGTRNVNSQISQTRADYLGTNPDYLGTNPDYLGTNQLTIGSRQLYCVTLGPLGSEGGHEGQMASGLVQGCIPVVVAAVDVKVDSEAGSGSGHTGHGSLGKVGSPDFSTMTLDDYGPL
ncbi:hypothetical protein B0H10DRAFT_1955540 [Mycena sp. CBHHK59/15]|nr:hypothetical protein B0H10DRAFT_1955540 [Mycena sp. CBHHK59/15]